MGYLYVEWDQGVDVPYRKGCSGVGGVMGIPKG